MSPFIITTSEPFDAAEHSTRPAFTRRAVATLEEARSAAYVAIGDNDSAPHFDGHFAVDNLTESGGTVGPLPDGTVVEVERIALRELRAATGLAHISRTPAEIIDAYNAAQGGTDG